MDFFSSKLFKYILAAAAIVAIVGAGLWLVNQVYAQGKKAGTDEANATNNAQLLELQQKLTKMQTDEAKQINDKIDKVLTFSQDAVTAVEMYTDQGRTLNQSVLSSLRGKTLIGADCKLTPDFQKAWEQIRKGSAK